MASTRRAGFAAEVGAATESDGATYSYSAVGIVVGVGVTNVPRVVNMLGEAPPMASSAPT